MLGQNKFTAKKYVLAVESKTRRHQVTIGRRTKDLLPQWKTPRFPLEYAFS
jgi:hypothetical protein